MEGRFRAMSCSSSKVLVISSWGESISLLLTALELVMEGGALALPLPMFIRPRALERGVTEESSISTALDVTEPLERRGLCGGEGDGSGVRGCRLLGVREPIVEEGFFTSQEPVLLDNFRDVDPATAFVEVVVGKDDVRSTAEVLVFRALPSAPDAER